MRRAFDPIRLAGMICILSAGLLSSLAAGQPASVATQPPGQKVAVLDVAAVIKNHPRFKDQTALIQADIKRADRYLAKDREQLKNRAQQWKQLPAGSARYLAEEKEIRKCQTNLDLRAEVQRKEFAQREAQVYYAAYKEIVDEVNDYARANGIAVVVRGSGSPLNASRPDQVLSDINRQIVWSDRGVDITREIIARLNRRALESKPVAVSVSPRGSAKPPAKDPKTEPAQPAAVTSEPAGQPKVSPKPDAPSPKPAARTKKKAKSKDQPEKKPDKSAAAKKLKVVRFVIKGSYPEVSSPVGLFSDFEQTLATVTKRMDQVAEDASVAAVLIRIEDLAVGRGKIHELRSAILRLRKAGKPVYAEVAGAETAEYLVAASCEQIALAPSGTLILPGVRAEMTFYKGLLDKLGVQFDLLQMGKYKGAGEPFTRTDLSPAQRESMEKMVNDSYEDIVGIIAKDRKLEPAKVKGLLDQGLFTAEMARKAGLVDQLAYSDQLQETIRQRLKADELDVVPAKEKKPVNTEFSGIGGFMKLMELAMGGKPAERPSQGKRIAVIYAVGPIVAGNVGGGLFSDETVSANTLVKALRSAADDAKVLAVVLRIDSPGGSAIASDLIWREVVQIKKPVVASMGDVAGSGGYYIAMGARKILAEPGTITGSIGVIGGKLVLSGLYHKVGITTEVISRGKNSGAMSDTHPFTPDERKAWTTLLEDTYRQFVDKAAQGRKMPVAKLEALAQGRIYTGRMAVANGLIDGLGTLNDAVAEAKKAAGLQPEEKVELWILPRPRSFFEQFFSESTDVATDLKLVLPRLGSTLWQADLLRRLFAEPAIVLMPFQVKVN